MCVCVALATDSLLEDRIRLRLDNWTALDDRMNSLEFVNVISMV